MRISGIAQLGEGGAGDHVADFRGTWCRCGGFYAGAGQPIHILPPVRLMAGLGRSRRLLCAGWRLGLRFGAMPRCEEDAAAGGSGGARSRVAIQLGG